MFKDVHGATVTVRMASPATPDELAEEKRLLRHECEKHIEFLDRLYAEIDSLRKKVAALENE